MNKFLKKRKEMSRLLEIMKYTVCKLKGNARTNDDIKDGKALMNKNTSNVLRSA